MKTPKLDSFFTATQVAEIMKAKGWEYLIEMEGKSRWKGHELEYEFEGENNSFMVRFSVVVYADYYTEATTREYPGGTFMEDWGCDLKINEIYVDDEPVTFDDDQHEIIAKAMEERLYIR